MRYSLVHNNFSVVNFAVVKNVWKLPETIVSVFFSLTFVSLNDNPETPKFRSLILEKLWSVLENNKISYSYIGLLTTLVC